MSNNELLDDNQEIDFSKKERLLSNIKEHKRKTFILLFFASIPTVFLTIQGQLNSMGHAIITVLMSWVLSYIVALIMLLMSICFLIILGLPTLLIAALCGFVSTEKIAQLAKRFEAINLYDYGLLLYAGILAEVLLGLAYFFNYIL